MCLNQDKGGEQGFEKISSFWAALTIIGSDNGLTPGQHQAIIWTSAGILKY